MLQLSFITLALWFGCAGHLAFAAARMGNAGAGDALFTNSVVREIRIGIDPTGMAELRRDTREYVKATFREVLPGGETVLTNVGIHLKGMGSFRPVDGKPAFTVKFNKFVEDQNFYGLTKIALNNSVQDGTYINESLCTELFRQAGVPAARVAHTRVYLNDRYLGLYVLVEGLNKPFLRRHFSDTKGNLYEGHTKDITEWLDQDNGEETLQADRKALAEAAGAPTAERWSKLSALIDMERFVSMLATEVLMAHWDGYWLNRNNYSIYHDPGTRRMTFMPNGLDNMFQLPGMSWRPTMQGAMVRAVLQTPEGQRAYRERLPQLLTNYFRVELLTNRIESIAARLRPVLQRDGAGLMKEFDANVTDLKRRVVARLANVSRQVSALGSMAKFDAAGVAPVGNWTTNVDAGLVIMANCVEDGRAALSIKHGDTSGTIASWRTRVGLEGGRYRFRGQVKAAGLLPLGSPNVGITLRVSGTHPPFQIVQDTNWRLVEFDFDVVSPTDDVDLICELSTVMGEVWFDLASLQLMRLRSDRSVVELRHPVK